MQTFWQTAQRFWQRYARILKLIFITSVILFVVITLGNFFKTVDWGAVSTELTSLPRKAPTLNFWRSNCNLTNDGV